MKNWLEDWKHKSILRGINRQKLEPGYVETSLRFQERAQYDAMPGLIMKPRPMQTIDTFRWITGYRELPAVVPFEQRMNRRLRLVR